MGCSAWASPLVFVHNDTQLPAMAMRESSIAFGQTSSIYIHTHIYIYIYKYTNIHIHIHLLVMCNVTFTIYSIDYL